METLAQFLASPTKSSPCPVGRYIGPPPASIPAQMLSPLALLDARTGMSPLPKRWQFLTIATDELTLGLGLVHLGYISQAFLHLSPRTALLTGAETLQLGAPGLNFSLSEHALHGLEASYQNPILGTRLAIRGTGCVLELTGSDRRSGFKIDARIELPQPADTHTLNVLGQDQAPAWIATVKSALLPVSGTLQVGEGKVISLDGGLAGLDCTVGFPPRHTRWHWGYALGRANDSDGTGRPMGFNFARGNNLGGQNENALWWDGKILTLPPVEFTPGSRDRRWMISGPGVALEFTEKTRLSNINQLGVVSSNLVQAYGEFAGTIRAPGTENTLTLASVGGICEDQDVLW